PAATTLLRSRRRPADRPRPRPAPAAAPGVAPKANPARDLPRRSKERKLNKRTAILGAAVIVVAVVLLIVLSNGGSDDKSSKTDAGEVPTIVVNKQGEPEGGITELTYHKGDQIKFEVESPIADEVHMHGYDIMKDVEPGGTVTFDFPATIEGVFEAEMED